MAAISGFQKSVLVRFAVSNTRSELSVFCGKYLRDLTYLDSILPKSNKKFLRHQFVCDYLTNTIKNIRL